MALTFDPTDPAQMTPEQRMEEVASILAAGALRLRRHAFPPPPPTLSEFPPESTANGLEVSAETRLHGHRG